MSVHDPLLAWAQQQLCELARAAVNRYQLVHDVLHASITGSLGTSCISAE